MAISLTQFIKKYLGTKVDFDGKFGPQCVDLARQYYSEVLDVPQFPPVEGAKDIIKNPGKLKVIKEDVLADYSSGDVLIWTIIGSFLLRSASVDFTLLKNL